MPQAASSWIHASEKSRQMKQWIKKLTGIVAEDTPIKGISWLFLPHTHVHILNTRRAALILSRIRIIAGLFALLTTLWIAIDFALLPFGAAVHLAYGRVAASLIFIWLAFAFRSSNKLWHAYIALVTLFAVPTAFYIYSHQILSGLEGNAFAATMLGIYSVLPVVVLAGISIFPLTALEAFIFSIPALLLVPLAAFYDVQLIDISTYLSAFWMLGMVAVVAGIAGMSQLGFMVSLMGQAMRDPLTRCFSRMSIEELLELQFILSSRNQSPLAIAFIDLDKFKSINDSYGHEAGDQVLNIAAASMRRHLRNGDMLGRWGGEEFILILPNTSMEQGFAAIQRIRQQGFGLRPDGTPVTASIGLAERSIDHARDWHALVEQADRRMYLAKESGRNRLADHQQVVESVEVNAI
jgi:diguanylate cyclase (GGDEF)-like protein